MLKINFTPSSNWADKELANLDDLSLRYQAFLGDVEFVHENNKIDLNWGWIPLLDIAYSLYIVQYEIKSLNHSEKSYDFTESDGLLIFRKNLSELKITTSYSDEEISISFTDFVIEISAFCLELIARIKHLNPDIINNINFLKYERKFKKL